MTEIDIERIKTRPKTKLILRNNTNNKFTSWLIPRWELVMGNRLVIEMPNTGYNTKEIVLTSTSGKVKDLDGNTVGIVVMPDKSEVIHIKKHEFARAIYDMEFGDTLYFYDKWDGGDNYSSGWGITKVKLIDSPMLVMGVYGGSGSSVFDLNTDTTIDEIEDYLNDELNCKIDDEIYFEFNN